MRKSRIMDLERDLANSANEGGDVQWDQEKYQKANREERREMEDRALASLQEEREIELIRNGISFAPAARVIPNASDSGPWNVGEDFKVDELSDAELKVAMTLGIVTMDVLTSEQQVRYVKAKKHPAPKGTASSLLGKVASGSTALAGRSNGDSP